MKTGAHALLLVVASAMGAHPTPAMATQAPPWIDSPQAAGYYSGVGVVSATDDRVQDLARAQEVASANLSVGIEATIRATYNSSFTESDREGITSISSRHTEVSTALQLPNVAVVGRWYDKKKKLHYCLVRVAIQTVEDFQEANYAEAANRISSAKSALDDALLAADIAKFAAGSTDLLQFLAGVVSSGVLGAQHRMRISAEHTGVSTALREVLHQVHIYATQMGPVPAGTHLDSTIRVRCSYNGLPIEGLALSAAFVDGKGYGEIEQRTETGHSGEAVLRLSSVDSISPNNTIRITALVFEGVSQDLVVTAPAPPSTEITIESYDPKGAITCVITARDQGDVLSFGDVPSRIADVLTRSGYQAMLAGVGAVPTPGKKLAIDLEADLISKSPVRGTYAFEAQLGWRVTDLKGELCRSGREVLTIYEKTDARFNRSFREKAYTLARRKIDDAARKCSQ